MELAGGESAGEEGGEGALLGRVESRGWRATKAHCPLVRLPAQGSCKHCGDRHGPALPQGSAACTAPANSPARRRGVQLMGVSTRAADSASEYAPADGFFDELFEGSALPRVRMTPLLHKVK